MKPVIEFVDEYNISNPRTAEDILSIVQVLRDNGYYEIVFDWSIDIYRGTNFSEIYYVKCVKWLEENYSNDYFQFQESVFFTNKEIATLMKLSIEK